MDANTLRIMTSSANEHWCTPKVILDPIRQHLGTIALDPCSNAGSKVGALQTFYEPGIPSPDGLHHDGLLETWQVDGVVYVNPPYGRKIVPWIKKCVIEGELAKQRHAYSPTFDTEIVLLGPARCDTKWMQRMVFPTADAVILLEGRLKFEGALHPAVFPSFLAYWGHRPMAFKVAYVGKGWAL